MRFLKKVMLVYESVNHTDMSYEEQKLLAFKMNVVNYLPKYAIWE